MIAKSSYEASKERKMVVNVNYIENGTSTGTNDGRSMHVYGLESDPNPGTIITEEDISDKPGKESLKTEYPLKQRQSPAMKLFRALTPSRKKNVEAKFNFEEADETVDGDD